MEGGDTLTYTVTLTNGGNATAYEVNFNDTLAQGTAFGAIQTAQINGTDTSLGTATANGDGSVITFSDDDWDLDPGDVLVLTYTASVTNAAVVDGSHVNTVDADWSSLDNTDPGEANERVYDEDDGVDSPVDGGANADRDVDTAEFAIPGVTISKSDGGITEATIGDTITYTLTLSAPEGTIDNLVIEDVLAAGLIFNNDAAISTASGSFSTELSQDPTFGTNDGSAAVTITWNLGDTIIDTDDDLLITYTARVADVVDNFDSAALGNTVTLSYDNVDGDEVTDSDTDGLSVVEPWIITSKDVSPATGVEGGDTLTYTVTLTNGGNATAYEVNFNDTLAQGTAFGAIQTAQINGTDTSLGTATANGDGSVITFSDDDWDLDPGDVLVLTYTASVTNAAVVDGSHVNTVDADWSSLDNTDPGEANERVYDEDDGVDSPVDGGANADRDVDTAEFAIPGVTISKSDGGITEATIGDTITYTLTLSAPEGTIDNLVIEDVLAAGLIFNNDAAISTASGSFSTELSQDPTFGTNDGSAAVTITWNLGDTIIDTDDDLLITYTARVADVVDNFDSAALGNTVTLSYDNVDGDEVTDSDTDGLSVVEPWIITSKDVSPATGVEGGDTLTYTVTLTNGGNATAYEVNFNDTLAQGTAFGAIQTAQINGTDTSLGTATANGDGSVITFSDDDWDLDPGDVLVLTYTASVTNAAVVDGSHVNTVDADWSSLDNTDPGEANERVYDEDDGVDSPVDGGANADRDVDTAEFAIPGVTISKSDGGITEATIGDTITYTLTLSAPEGTIDNLVIEDVLAAGLIFNNDAAISTASGSFSTELSQDPTFGTNDGSAAVTITWNLGDTIIDTDDDLLITYTARVADVVDNFDSAALGNTVTLSYDNVDGDEVTDSDTDGLSVVEPWIITSKDVSPATGVEGGDTLTYTVTLTNGGNATAYEVNFNDTLAQGTAFGAIQTAQINGTDTSLGTATANGDGSVITFSDDDWDLDPGDVLVLTYTASVTNAAVVDGSHVNTVDADWSSLDNTDPGEANERVYDEDDGVDSPVDGGANADRDVDTAEFAIPGVTISKSDGGITEATIGDTITYTLTLSAPEGTIDNLVIEDVLAAGLIFNNDAAISTASGSFSTELSQDPTFGTNDGSAAVTITWNLGDTIIDTDDDLLITYTARVADVVDNFDSAALGNTVTLSYDNVDGDEVTDSDTDGLSVVEPWIITSKDVSPATGVEGGDTLTYTVTLTNGGNATAYEVNFNDTLAQGTAFGAIQTAQINGTDTSLGTATANGDGSVITFSDDDWDLDPGDVLVLTYTASVTNAAVVDGSHVNTVDADWSSLDNTDPGEANERVYDEDDGVDSPVDGGANADRDVDTAEFAIPGVTISKSDGGITEATIGDTITYTLTLSAPEGTIDNLVIEDVLAAGLIFNNDAAISTASGSFSTELSQDPTFGTNDGSAAVTITWNLGDTIIDTDDDLLITYTARVADVVDNFDSAALGNTVTLSYDNVDGDEVTDSDTDGLSVVEPQITTEKSVTDSGDTGTDAEWNETLTYTVRFTNSGNATAYEVNAVDTLAPGTLFDALTLTSSSFGAVADPTMTDNGDGTVSIVGNWDIPVGNYVEIQYTATVLDAVFLAPPHENSVDADWSSQDGVSLNERQYDDTGTSPVDGDLDTDDAVFTVFTTGSIGDTVFFDTNNNGIEDAGDTGITDILVTLSADTDGDGTADFTWTDVTDADGQYLFENLPAFDSYTITVDPVNLPDGTEATYDLDGIDTEHVISGIVLGVEEVRDDVDFGYFNSGTGSIGDTVWYDADADGVLDAGEQGLGGVQLTLTGDITGDGLDDISVTTTTDENGNYTFAQLLPGDYTVTVDSTPAGMVQTFDLDGLFTPDNASIALADGENNNNVDFGYTGAASIGDTIYFDADNSGTEDPGDAGIPGVTVTLTGDLNNDGIEDILTTVTDENGNYLFENLPDGVYTVSVDPDGLPAGMSPTADPDGGGDNMSAVTLAGGVDNPDQDFGYTGTGIIGDTIWEDTNGDGIQNGSETGLGGVDVTIAVDFDGDGTADYTGTATTDGSGNYSFDNLPAGTYTIAVDTNSIPAGYVLTGDPDINPDSTSTVDLPAGGTNLDQDFGYQNSGVTSPVPSATPSILMPTATVLRLLGSLEFQV